ncbi:hypothetical protein AAON49_13185 [Pseudotenacibaculum sp. MALMAid0570]|uniref:hypothetical protein n=1 Tax=Pseudotenacibaculum sp. MALMAid0570 TaxID=3143938 RepID=UPI0032DF27CC
MDSYYLEKRLRYLNGKIKRLEKNSNFFGKNIIKVILFGIGFSFLAPRYYQHDSYTGYTSDTIQERMDGNYWNAVLLCAGVYISLSLLGHFIWGIQDRRKMKKLIERKRKIEEKISSRKRE